MKSSPRISRIAGFLFVALLAGPGLRQARADDDLDLAFLAIETKNYDYALELLKKYPRDPAHLAALKAHHDYAKALKSLKAAYEGNTAEASAILKAPPQIGGGAELTRLDGAGAALDTAGLLNEIQEDLSGESLGSAKQLSQLKHAKHHAVTERVAWEALNAEDRKAFVEAHPGYKFGPPSMTADASTLRGDQEDFEGALSRLKPHLLAVAAQHADDGGLDLAEKALTVQVLDGLAEIEDEKNGAPAGKDESAEQIKERARLAMNHMKRLRAMNQSVADNLAIDATVGDALNKETESTTADFKAVGQIIKGRAEAALNQSHAKPAEIQQLFEKLDTIQGADQSGEREKIEHEIQSKIEEGKAATAAAFKVQSDYAGLDPHFDSEFKELIEGDVQDLKTFDEPLSQAQQTTQKLKTAQQHQPPAQEAPPAQSAASQNAGPTSKKAPVQQTASAPPADSDTVPPAAQTNASQQKPAAQSGGTAAQKPASQTQGGPGPASQAPKQTAQAPKQGSQAPAPRTLAPKEEPASPELCAGHTLPSLSKDLVPKERGSCKSDSRLGRLICNNDRSARKTLEKIVSDRSESEDQRRAAVDALALNILDLGRASVFTHERADVFKDLMDSLEDDYKGCGRGMLCANPQARKQNMSSGLRGYVFARMADVLSCYCDRHAKESAGGPYCRGSEGEHTALASRVRAVADSFNDQVPKSLFEDLAHWLKRENDSSGEAPMRARGSHSDYHYD